MPPKVPYQFRRDTEANCISRDPVLLAGEPLFSTDTGAFKIGDGASKFSELPNVRKQFQSVITVAKTGKPGTADFICSDSVYGGDDAACIQAALDHISNLGGGHLYITGGHYYCNSQLLYQNSNLILTGSGENTILDFTGAASGLWCIYIHGSISETISLLTTDAVASDLTVTVANGALFSANNWIRIRSNAIFNNWTQHVGEIQQIESISGDSITLKEQIFGSYAISDTATVDKVNMIENITLKNFKIVATNSNNNFGITVSQSHNVKIDGITSENFADRSIYLNDVVSAKIYGCQIKKSNKTDLGYGIAVVNCSRDIIGNANRFFDCRHAITCGGDNTYGIQYNQVYSNNTQSYDSQGQGMFGMHNTYDGLVVSGNTIGSDGLGYFAGIHHTITGNNLSNVSKSAGIRISQNSSGFTIANNTIVTKSDQHAIYIAGSAKNILIIGNNIDSDWHGIYSEYEINNLNVVNNQIKALHYGIYLRDNAAVNQSTRLIINNNIITGDITGIGINLYNFDFTNVQITNNNITGGSSSTIELWPNSIGHQISNLKLNGNMIVGGIYGITCASCTDFTIENNKINNSTTGIYIRSNWDNCSDYRVLNNKITGCPTSINNAPGVGFFENNDGYKTENTGTATLLQNTTSIIVSHGLASTPTNVIATPKGNIGSCWVDTYTATTFVIHCSTAPASDVDVNWTAIV